MKVSATLHSGMLRIYINDLPHLVVKRDQLVGFQSWMKGADGLHCIEIYTITTTILLEYNTLDKWKKVLKVLEKSLELY